MPSSSSLFAVLLAVVACFCFGFSSATSTSKPSLGIITCYDFWPEIVYQYLSTCGSFSYVNQTDASKKNVTLEWMQQFDVILYFSNSGLFDPEYFGNTLAAYLDAGGAVVTGVYQLQTCCPDTIATGRFLTDYQVIGPDVHDTNDAPTAVGSIYFPNHPIFHNFNNFSTNLDLFHLVYPNASLAPNSYILARFQDNTFTAAVRDAVGPGGRNRVDLGWWPSAAFHHNVTGAIQFTVEALLYAVGPGYMTVPSSLVSCSVPNAYDLFPTIEGLSLAFQYPLPGSSVPFNSTITMSFSVNLPGPSMINGSLTIDCTPSCYEGLSCSRNVASRATSSVFFMLLEDVWTAFKSLLFSSKPSSSVF